MPYDGCSELCALECSAPTPRPTSAPGAGSALACQRAIAKEASRLVQARVRALQKCHDKLLRGKLGPDPGPNDGDRLAFCLEEPRTQLKLARASSKIVARIDQRCGGLNGLCETPGDVEEPDPNDLGFYATCPGLDGQGTCAGGAEVGAVCTGASDCTGGGVCVACDWAIDDCGDIADCLECLGAVASNRALLLYYDEVQAAAAGDLAKCQVAIGKEATKYLQQNERLLQKCWDKALKGQHQEECPDADAPADSVAFKTALKIAKAESKMIDKICRACGGPDGRCDDSVVAVRSLTPPYVGSSGGDDLTPVEIGFPAACDPVTVPAGPACGIAVGTLADLVFCVDCVSEFKVDCLDAARVPELQGRVTPCQCNP